MEIIVGSIILNENKVLMVKEAKKECFSKWSFPGGHLKEGESLFEGAKRETLEETGCNIELKKAFPILLHNSQNRNLIIIYFLANLMDSSELYNTDEILETKWMTLDEIKKMDKAEIRSYLVVENIIKNLDSNNLYELDIFKNLPNI